MILVIDNYDSFTYNLVHLVGRYTKHVRVVRNDTVTIQDIEAMSPRGILLSPGPGRPDDAGICKDIVHYLSPSIPILGICLGHQAIGEVFGGDVTYAPALMHGKTSVIAHDGKSIFKNIPQHFTATRYHSLVVKRSTLPDSLEISAESDDGVIMGLRHRSLPVEGVQFHPESVLTTSGPDLIATWLINIAMM